MQRIGGPCTCPASASARSFCAFGLGASATGVDEQDRSIADAPAVTSPDILIPLYPRLPARSAGLPIRHEFTEHAGSIAVSRNPVDQGADLAAAQPVAARDASDQAIVAVAEPIASAIGFLDVNRAAFLEQDGVIVDHRHVGSARVADAAHRRARGAAGKGLAEFLGGFCAVL